MSEVQTLESEIAGEEKAIRLLLGEQKALENKRRAIVGRRHRDEARLKLERARLHNLLHHPPVPERAGRVPHGSRFPDVSSYQPNVNLSAVHQGAGERVGQLLVTKATEGASWADAFFRSRWHEMHVVGFPHRGAYHFLHPSVSPVEQANHFLETLTAGGGMVTAQDVVVCDAEVSDGVSAAQVRQCVREFGQTVGQHVPARRWLYSGGPFAQEQGLTLDGYHAHWLAAYVSSPWPFAHFGRARTVAWQYSDGQYGPQPHRCPGIGPCDMSIVL